MVLYFKFRKLWEYHTTRINGIWTSKILEVWYLSFPHDLDLWENEQAWSQHYMRVCIHDSGHCICGRMGFFGSVCECARVCTWRDVSVSVCGCGCGCVCVCVEGDCKFIIDVGVVEYEYQWEKWLGLSPTSELPREEGEYCPQFMCRCPVRTVPGKLESVVWNVRLFSVVEIEGFGTNHRDLTCM
jgi:hypothetical protein